MASGQCLLLSLLVYALSTVCWATRPSIRAFKMSRLWGIIPPEQALECQGELIHINTQLFFSGLVRHPEQP